MNESGAKAGLNLPTVAAIPVVLPKLMEQKKIAQILAGADEKRGLPRGIIAQVEKIENRPHAGPADRQGVGRPIAANSNAS